MAGVVAAAGVMLSGAVAPKLYLGHIVVLYGYAWFPLALALAIRSSRRATLWPHPALVAVLVLQVLAGFVQGTLYVGIVVAAVFLWRALGAPAAERRLGTSLLQPSCYLHSSVRWRRFSCFPRFTCWLTRDAPPASIMRPRARTRSFPAIS